MDFSCTLIVLWLPDVWDTASDSHSYFNSNDWGRIVNPKKKSPMESKGVRVMTDKERQEDEKLKNVFRQHMGQPTSSF